MSSNINGLTDSFSEDLTMLQCQLRNLLTRNDISCISLVESYEKLQSTGTIEDAVSSFKCYVKTVLDLTFCYENILVDEEFKGKDAPGSVNEIINILTDIESITHHFGSRKVDVLNKEVTKCLLWRKGALLYMYCATIYADPQRNSVTEESHFSKFLSDGVTYLKLMLEVYDPSYITEDSEMCNTKDIATLLINGVRDSSDMLALMYAGEMCYWYYDLSNQSPPLNIFPARQMAVHFLQKYVKLSKEPCFGQSWSCDRAISLLNLLISSSQ